VKTNLKDHEIMKDHDRSSAIKKKKCKCYVWNEKFYPFEWRNKCLKSMLLCLLTT